MRRVIQSSATRIGLKRPFSSGMPQWKPTSGVDGMRTCEIVEARVCIGQPFDGADQGPAFIKSRGLERRLADIGWRVRNAEPIDVVHGHRSPSENIAGLNARFVEEVCATSGRIFKATKAAAEANRFVLTLGGDHSVATGSVAGLLAARPELGVVWVDAHADINTPISSPSGNMHGMPVSLLTKIMDPARLPNCQWLVDVPALNPQRLVYIGLRDLDANERRLLPELGIKYFTMQHVDKFGIGKVVEMALDHLAGSEEIPLHLSYDIDGTDPAVAPSTGTPVPGGLSLRESHFICEAISDTGLLGSMDLVEVNPELAKNDEARNLTGDTAVALICSALGSRII